MRILKRILLFAGAVKLFHDNVGTVHIVEGSSMQPTLNPIVPLNNMQKGQFAASDWVYVNKTLNSIFNPNTFVLQKGDIVVFR